MDNQIVEMFNINFIINYIKDNLIGLLLFLFVFYIIYLVDHINNINAFILSALNMADIKNPIILNKNIILSKNIKKHKNKNK